MTSGSSPFESKSQTESPNLYIFPASVINKRTAKAACTDKPYAPGELIQLILDHNHAVDSIGTIFVTELSYYKLTTGARHEYLIVRVQDADRQFKNYIKLDRCPAQQDVRTNPPVSLNHEDCSFDLSQDDLPTGVPNVIGYNSQESSGRLSFFSGSSNLLGQQIARDQFLVSGSGELNSIHNDQPQLLATVRFSQPGRPGPTVEELVILAHVVSTSQPRYHLFQTQCYWYAYTIWGVLKLQFEDSASWPAEPLGAGTNGFLPWIEWHKTLLSEEGKAHAGTTIRHTHAKLAAKYLVAWDEFTKESARCQQAHGARAEQGRLRCANEELARAKAEVTRAQRETARIQAEAARIQAEAARIQAEAAEQVQAKVANLQAKNTDLERELVELRRQMSKAAEPL